MSKQRPILSDSSTSLNERDKKIDEKMVETMDDEEPISWWTNCTDIVIMGLIAAIAGIPLLFLT